MIAIFYFKLIERKYTVPENYNVLLVIIFYILVLSFNKFNIE